MSGDFRGFSHGTVAFWQELRQNNDKLWFDRHEARYRRDVLEPSRDFVVAMGERLRELAPLVRADPRVNGSLFRIYRDTRFSPDKSPYKTHMGLWFWDGEGARMACSGFYFQLEPPNVMVAAGIYRLPKELLEAYREAVADDRRGPALAAAVAAIEAAGLAVGNERYRRVPRGCDPGHPRARLLRFDGLYAFTEEPIPPALFGEGLVEWCFERWAPMLPLHEWLRQMVDDARVRRCGSPQPSAPRGVASLRAPG